MSSTITALTSGGGIAVAGDTSGQLELKTNNGTTAMTINTSQQVGIGQTSPTSGCLLDVKGGDIRAENTSGSIRVRLVGGSNQYSLETSSGTNALQFIDAAAGAERMRIASTGNVGIGANNPSYLLQVGSFINSPCVAMGVTGSGAGFADGSVMFLGSDFQNPNSMSGTTNANFKFSTSRTGCIAASNNGTYIYEGFTSASGSRSFAVLSNGNVQNTNNSYGSLSDASLKQDIVDASSQWNDIKNLKVRKYRFIDDVIQNPDAKSQIGLVAQEAELISAGLIDKQIIYKQKLDADGNPIMDSYGIPEMEVDKELKTIKYSVLYMKAVKALQEAMERIEALEAKVSAK